VDRTEEAADIIAQSKRDRNILALFNSYSFRFGSDCREENPGDVPTCFLSAPFELYSLSK
jgi:hypothetical protein